MARATPSGEFCVGEFYTLEELATKLGHTRRWVYETFIRPTNHQTKERLKDFDGSPLRGVMHVRSGDTILIAGANLLRWIQVNGELEED